jgi:hypothetical protein
MTVQRDDVQRKHRGAYNELAACQWLLAQGYEVFRNVSPYGMVDIVAVRGDEILKIDVKSDGGCLGRGQVGKGIAVLHVSDDGTFELDRSPIVLRNSFATCVGCGQTFRKRAGTQKWCSRRCKPAAPDNLSIPDFLRRLTA